MNNKRLYEMWTNMKTRCLNPNYHKWHRYGGRGINVCSDWLRFDNFKEWAMKNGYKNNLQIDRINNEGDYKPSNCRFVTNKENSRNKSNLVINLNLANKIRKEYKTQTRKNISEIARRFGVNRRSVSYIVNNKQWI